jgi:carboxyl-terminal processing protease
LLKKTKYWLVPVLVLVFLVGGWVFNLRPAIGVDEFASLRDGFTIYKTVLDNVIKYYVDRDKVDVDKIIKRSIDGMLEDLDPYTKYLPESEYESQNTIIKGEYGGLGLSIWVMDKVLTVREVFNGTPAANVGIQAGDRIIKIENVPTRGVNLDEAVKKMRGKPGTEVTITIDREAFSHPLDFTIVRDVIKIPSVAFADLVKNKIGYVRLVNFSKDTDKELKEAVLRLEGQGMQGLVLDLRGNPGGLLQQAVEVSDEFLAKNNLIVSTRGRHENQNQEFRAQGDRLIGDQPLVVLVDRGSASASEIVSGAIQDWDRGVILGTITWGKGLVQTVLPVGKGNSALKITTAKYYTPSGRCIQRDKPNNEEMGTPDTEDSSLVNADQNIGQKKAGPAVNAPDSIKPKEIFKTNAGRAVYGGGGITPDLEAQQDTISKIELDLLRQNLFFKFAVQYVAGKKLKPAVYGDLAVDDGMLTEFKNFIKAQKFDYKSELEVEFDRFAEQVKKHEHDYPALGPKVDELRRTLDQEGEDDFHKNLAGIRNRVKIELAAKLWGNDGRIRAGLERDHQLDQALALFADPQQYRQILSTGIQKTNK